MFHIDRGCSVFILSIAIGLFSIPSAEADVKILDSGKVKSVKTPKKKSKGAQRNRNFFHKDPDHPANKFEPSEVLVLNPPKDFPAVVGGLGYRITESVNLDGLGLAVYRLRVPSGVTVPEAVRQLAGRFPGATIDANHAFEAASAADQCPRRNGMESGCCHLRLQRPPRHDRFRR